MADHTKVADIYQASSKLAKFPFGERRVVRLRPAWHGCGGLAGRRCFPQSPCPPAARTLAHPAPHATARPSTH